MKISLRALLGGLLMVSVVACGDPPPPKDPPEPAPEPLPPPPPPKPTCKAMKDHCQADAQTAAAIPNVAYVFTPPAGWEFAMLEEATVTQMSDDGAVLVLTSMETDKAAYKANAQRTATVQSLAELVNISPPAKLNFTRPNKRKMSGMTMTLWENEAKRGEKKGALLLLSATAGGRDIFGIGYAPTGDADGTKAILAALETFKASESESDADEASESEDGDGKKK